MRGVFFRFLAALFLSASSVSAQQIVETVSAVTPLGDLIVVRYDRRQTALTVSHVKRDGSVQLDGTLPLGTFPVPPVLVGFEPRRNGGLDLVLEAVVGGSNELAFIRISESGGISFVSNTASGADMRGAQFAPYNDGVIVAGSLRQAGRRDRGAALTVFSPGQPPRTVVRDSTRDERFLAVRRTRSDEVLALGVVEQNGAPSLFLSRFNDALEHQDDTMLPIDAGINIERIMAVDQFTAGFLVLHETGREGSSQSFALNYLGNDGRIVRSHQISFPVVSTPKRIIEFSNGEIVVDARITGQVEGRENADLGRIAALIARRGASPVVAMRQSDAAVTEPFLSQGHAFELIRYQGESLFRLPISSAQLAFEETVTRPDLPNAGLIGFELLGNSGVSYLLNAAPNQRCRLQLAPAPYANTAMVIDLSRRPEIIGYADNTLTIFGSGMFMVDGRSLGRIDLLAPQEIDGVMLAQRLRALMASCTG